MNTASKYEPRDYFVFLGLRDSCKLCSLSCRISTQVLCPFHSAVRRWNLRAPGFKSRLLEELVFVCRGFKGSLVLKIPFLENSCLDEGYVGKRGFNGCLYLCFNIDRRKYKDIAFLPFRWHSTGEPGLDIVQVQKRSPLDRVVSDVLYGSDPRWMTDVSDQFLEGFCLLLPPHLRMWFGLKIDDVSTLGESVSLVSYYKCWSDVFRHAGIFMADALISQPSPPPFLGSPLEVTLSVGELPSGSLESLALAGDFGGVISCLSCGQRICLRDGPTDGECGTCHLLYDLA